MPSTKLLTTSNHKTSKGEKYGWLTGILYLAPNIISGVGNVCSHSTAGCRASCLYYSGMGAYPKVQRARIAKTKAFFKDSAAFVDQLSSDILALAREANRKNLKLAIRLNGTSDIRWERVRGTDGEVLMHKHKNVLFYDYTKIPNRMTGFLNYYLIFSRSETNEKQSLQELEQGKNVAIVFDIKKGDPLPAHWNRYPVIDGDTHDLRFLDSSRSNTTYVVGLRAKGRARTDRTGFAYAKISSVMDTRANRSSRSSHQEDRRRTA